MCLVSHKKELKENFYLKSLEHTEQQIQARIQFREQRFYWLYFGSCAIGGFLFSEYKADNAAYWPVYYGGLMLIQFLSIGIGWNYYANDIKIQKLEWKVKSIFKDCGVPPVRYHDQGMSRYRDIYTFLEILAISLPTLVAFVAVLAMDISHAPGGPGMACGNADCICRTVAHYLTTFISGLITLGTIIGAYQLGTKRKKYFHIPDND